MLVRVLVTGEYAGFARPELTRDLISYPILPPPAAQGILDAIYWFYGISWIVERIHILKPINIQDFWVGSRRERLLVDVAYVLEAKLTLNAKGSGSEDHHVGRMKSYLRRQKLRKPPFLGSDRWPASVVLIEVEDLLPESTLQAEYRNSCVGWMPHSVLYHEGGSKQFFNARLEDGVLSVPPAGSDQLAR